jgi:hypothetical protein
MRRTPSSPRRLAVRAFLAASLATLAFVVSAGCVVVEARPARSQINAPPPTSQAEAPLACQPGYTRVAGYWRWNGYQYVWIPQRCAYRPGYRWEPGGYTACGDGWCFKEGVWIQIGR